MASRNFKIKVVVEDAATNRLKRVERQVKQTGQTVDNTAKRFMNFNRTLFATTAFIGIFIKAFQGIGNSLSKGADFELVEKQFERTLGPKGNLIRQIKGMTDIAIDRMDAMRASIQLANLGVIQSSSQAATIISKAGVAAKLSAMDTTEGIERVTRFLKTANIQELEALNLIRTGDPELRQRLGVIGATAKAMSPAVRAQYLYTEGLRLLDKATRNAMFGQRSLSDTLKDFKDTFNNLGGQLGKFLGKALSPIIDGFTSLGDRLADVLEKLTLNKKFIQLTKVVLTAGAALSSLVLVLGSLKLATMALSSVGLGLPKLIMLGMLSAGIFSDLSKNIDDTKKNLQTFSNFIQAVWQLVTSLDKETGISRIDSELKSSLGSLYPYAQNIARTISVVSSAVSGMIEGLKSTFNTLVSVLKNVSKTIANYLGMDQDGPWSLSWLDNAKSFGKILGSTVLPVLAAISAFKLGRGLLTKIPIVGKLFGGGSGPKGTATDPIHTVSMGDKVGMMGKAGNFVGNLPIFGKIKSVFQNFLLKIPILGNILTHPAGKMKALTQMLGKAATGLGGLALKFGPTALALGAAATAGYLFGKKLTETFPQLTKLGDWAYELIHGKSDISKFNSDEDIRGIFEHAKKMGWSKDQTFEEYKKDYLAKQQKTSQTAKKSQVSTPYNVKDEMLKIDELGTSISAIKDTEHRKQAQAQLEAFLSAESEGGAQITDNERRLLMEGMEQKNYLRQIAENTKDSKKNKEGSRR